MPKVIHERERVTEAEIKYRSLSDLAAECPCCEYTLHSILDALPGITSEYFKRGRVFPDSNVMLMTSVWPWVDEFPFEKYQPFMVLVFVRAPLVFNNSKRLSIKIRNDVSGSV